MTHPWPVRHILYRMMSEQWPDLSNEKIGSAVVKTAPEALLEARGGAELCACRVWAGLVVQ